MIFSMTGFAKQQQLYKGNAIVWELKTVNSRYLDIHFHLSEYFRELEMPLKDMIQQYILRGKIDATLSCRDEQEFNQHFVINQSLVKKLKREVTLVEHIFGHQSKINPLDVLRWPGVVQFIRPENAELQTVILRAFEKCLQKLQHTREQEGKKLSKVIIERLSTMNREIKKIEKHIPRIILLERERLLNRFSAAKVELDPARLEQELLLLAQKMDVREELDRLKIHVEETKNLLNSTEKGIGRRLDFIMQEFNREANTLGSKAVVPLVTKASVEMKVLIEQMREQIQNIE